MNVAGEITELFNALLIGLQKLIQMYILFMQIRVHKYVFGKAREM